MVNFACRSPYANALSISTDARETLGLDDGMLVCTRQGVFASSANNSRPNSVSMSTSSF